MMERKYKQLYHYMVDFSKEEHICTVEVKGKALFPLELMAKSIVIIQ